MRECGSRALSAASEVLEHLLLDRAGVTQTNGVNGALLPEAIDAADSLFEP